MLSTKEVVQVLKTLPSEQSDLPVGFTDTDPARIKGIFDNFAQLADEGELIQEAQDIASGEALTAGLLAELDKLKNQLGGTPIFGKETPSINPEDSTKTFLGIPKSAVKDWFRMTLNKGWVPNFFWSALAKLFGVTNDNQMSQYEEAHIRIQRFGLLIANKERFKEILTNRDSNRYSELAAITGLAWHPTQNDPAIEKVYIDAIETFLTDYFEDAKANGEEALIEYFNAFEGVCFEDRARTIEEYMKTHPLKGQEVDKSALYLADYDTNATLETMYNKEAQEYALKNGDAATPQELWDVLVGKGVTDKEFADGKPTPASFNEFAENAIDYCILNEGELIQEAPSKQAEVDKADRGVTAANTADVEADKVVHSVKSANKS